MANVGGSANVSVREVEIGTRVPSFPGVYGALAIPAKKGPINEPTLVTSDSQFLRRYTPNEKIDIGMDNSHFSALNYLQQSNKLWINRVAVNALYAIMLYSSGNSEVPTLKMHDEIGADTVSDTIGVTASFSKYINTGDIVTFTTDDDLPVPLAINTNYYAIKKDNGTIQVAYSYEDSIKLKKQVNVDLTTETFTVGTPIDFSVNIATNNDRLTVAGHGLSTGDTIRLTPSPLAPVVFSVTFLTDDTILNFGTSHGLVDGQKIRLSTSGTLPTGLTAPTLLIPYYYVTVVDTVSIKLSTTNGGTFVQFTSNGSGTHQVDAGVLPAPLNPKSFTVTNGTNVNNLVFGSAHGLVDGQQIRLSTTGTLPTTSPALDEVSFYYVNVVDTLTITLSLTIGGSPLTFSADGASPNYVNPEIHKAIVLNANSISIEPVVGNGAVVFTDNGFSTMRLTKPHGLTNLTPIQFTSVGKTGIFTTVVAVSNKVFNSVGHGLTNGTVILVNNEKETVSLPNNDLPSGLVKGTRYYVINATTNTFELSSTFGSVTQVTFADNGTGTHYFNTGVLPETFGGQLDFNTTYYITSLTFDTFKVSASATGSPVLDITDYGSGVLQFETGFIDLTGSYVGTSYIHREAYSLTVKSSTFTTNVPLDNRLLLDANVVSLLDTGTAVKFTSKGLLPNPLLSDKTYYVIKYPIKAPETQLQPYHTNSTTIKLAISEANALAYSPTNDTSLTLTSNGSGTHSIYYTRGLSEVVDGYETGNIVDSFVINQDSLNETVIVSSKFGERMITGDAVKFNTQLGGKLPLPLLANTTYYVVKVSDTEFKLATTKANALASIPVVIDLTDNVSFSLQNADTANDYSVDPVTDTFTLPSTLTTFGSMMTTGTPVTVSVITTTSAPTFNVLSASDKLPRPLKPNVTYYWISVTDTNFPSRRFKLALTPNDAVLGIGVDITDVGSGDEMLIALDGVNKITFTPSVADPTAFNMGSDDLLMFYSANQGAWGNDVFVRLEDYRHKEADTFLVKVFKRSNLNIPVETFVCSRKTKKDGRGQNVYITDVLDSSAYIRCVDNTLIDDTVFPIMSVATTTNPNVRSLTGGNDGDVVTEGKMILGVDNFRNTEKLPVTVLMDGGWSFPSFQRELDAIAQARQDCVAILSTPFDKEASSDDLE